MTTQRISSPTQHAVRTDVGAARDQNEDRYLAQPPLFVVADGLGGHSAGEVAAQILVDRLELLTGEITGAELVSAMESADRLIRDASRIEPGRQGMGTTCVAILLGDGFAQVSHVGDSRAYRLRGRSLSRLTVDHSVVAELIRGGVLTEADATLDERRHMLTQALGLEPRAIVSSTPLAVEAGDRYLLCSDGLSSQVPDPLIEAVLIEISDPGLAADELVRRANAAGGTDNVTVIVVDAQVGARPSAVLAPSAGARVAPASAATSRTRSRAAIVVLLALLFVLSAVAAFIVMRPVPERPSSPSTAPTTSATRSTGPPPPSGAAQLL